MAKLFCFVAAAICLAGIVSGEEPKSAWLGQFPHHVSINIWGKHNCSGAIINEHWIITAASCVDTESLDDIKIVSVVTDSKAHGDQYLVELIEAQEHKNRYDIALVKTKEAIQFNKYAMAVPLDKSVVSGVTLTTVSGWIHDDKDHKLKYTHMNTILEEECVARFKKYGDFVGPDMLCALPLTSLAVELGSPLINGGRQLVGIAMPHIESNTEDPLPSRFTRISTFAHWIESFTGTKMEH